MTRTSCKHETAYMSVKKSYGWEARSLIRGELFASHGAFPMRAGAIEWAEEGRPARILGDVPAVQRKP